MPTWHRREVGMTLNSTLITNAYRESNFTGQGATLTTEEQTEGLQLLQSLTDSFFGLIVGTKPKPWFVPYPFNTSPEQGNYPAVPGDAGLRDRRDVNYPPPNSRVFLRNAEAHTVYFQYQPEDGALMQIVDAGFTADVTIDGNGMFIGDTGTNKTETIPPSSPSRLPPRTYVFRGDIASWVQTSDLIYAGENPFPAAFDDYWVTALAMRLAPRFGNMPNEVTMLRNKDMLNFIRGEYRQTEEAVIGDAGLPTKQSHTYWAGGYPGDPDLGRI